MIVLMSIVKSGTQASSLLACSPRSIRRSLSHAIVANATFSLQASSALHRNVTRRVFTPLASPRREHEPENVFRGARLAESPRHESALCRASRLDVFYMFVTVYNFVLVGAKTLNPTPAKRQLRDSQPISLGLLTATRSTIVVRGLSADCNDHNRPVSLHL